MFRQADIRRVQMALDTAIPQPYEAVLTLEDSKRSLMIRIADPDNAAQTIAQASFPFQEGRSWRARMQPSEDDLTETVQRLTAICAQHAGG